MLGLDKIFRKPSLGEWGESEVAKIYSGKGYKILDKNYFNRKGKRLGEVDVIALKDKTVVFVEVKTRTSDKFGSPAEAVNTWKKQRLIKACHLFMAEHPEYRDYGMRIDVAEVIATLDRKGKSVNIIENAVEDNF